MAEVERSERVIRRPSVLAVMAVLTLVVIGIFVVFTREWPATPASRSGRNFSASETVPMLESVDLDLATSRSTDTTGTSRLIVAADGQLLLYDLESPGLRVVVDDVPLTKPLVVVEGGVVGVSRGSALFVSSDLSRAGVVLGDATEVFRGAGAAIWLSHNDAGPAYVEKLATPDARGSRFDLGGGVLVHGLADSGLLLGRSGSTQVVEPESQVVVAEVPTFTRVLSVRADVVVGIDGRCDERRCSLIVVDAATGTGGEWDMDEFRLPNLPTAELSPDASHLAIFVVDRFRNLSVGVVNLATGEFRRGATLGSSRRSADLSWSRDGRAVFYIDPETPGSVREFRPFDDRPSDVGLPVDFGALTSIADIGG